MKNLQVQKFATPKEITQEVDRSGCVGFTSYGFIQTTDGEVHHVKNPDFNWKNARYWKPTV